MQAVRNKVFRVLRASERIFKLDMVYLAKGGFWTTLRFTVGTLASIVTMVAFGNLLSRADIPNAVVEIRQSKDCYGVPVAVIFEAYEMPRHATIERLDRRET